MLGTCVFTQSQVHNTNICSEWMGWRTEYTISTFSSTARELLFIVFSRFASLFLIFFLLSLSYLDSITVLFSLVVRCCYICIACSFLFFRSVSLVASTNIPIAYNLRINRLVIIFGKHDLNGQSENDFVWCRKKIMDPKFRPNRTRMDDFTKQNKYLWKYEVKRTVMKPINLFRVIDEF